MFSKLIRNNLEINQKFSRNNIDGDFMITLRQIVEMKQMSIMI